MPKISSVQVRGVARRSQVLGFVDFYGSGNAYGEAAVAA
jgi:hypothetical protein